MTIANDVSVSESEWLALTPDEAVPTQLRRRLRMAMWVVLLLFGWAALAPLEEVTHSSGKVVPSGRIQTVQHLEGGIIRQFFVAEGDLVRAGRDLLQLDGTSVVSSREGNRATKADLEVRLVRLQAELDAVDPIFPEWIITEQPALVAAQTRLFHARRDRLAADMKILEQQFAQKKRFVEELTARLGTASSSAELAHRELEMSTRLVEKQVISEVEFLRLKRSVNDLDGKITGTKIEIQQAESALAETRSQMEERNKAYRSKISNELSNVEAERIALEQGLVDLDNRVDRLMIKSPVDGVIKDIAFNTRGGVIAPGEAIMDIVPVDAQLIVEARIHPRDIGYLETGQRALVKVSAFDYRRYGGLDGTVMRISPDSSIDQNGEPYYRIRVETDKAYLGEVEGKQFIVSGMTVTVDIITGVRTVLDYLARPFLDLHSTALTEH